MNLNTRCCSTQSNTKRPINVLILRVQCFKNSNNNEEANSPTTANLRCYLMSCCICGVRQSHPAIAFLRFLSKVDT